MSASPLVTVVVPSYNGERFLGRTLDSLEAQDHDALEVIVVDDGSTDGSVELARRHPLAPRVVEQRNAGVAVARNRGLALAAGEWVGFIDQDDLWHRGRISTLLRLAAETGADAVATSESQFARSADRARLAEVGDGRESWPTIWVDAEDEASLIDRPLPEASGRVTEITLERMLSGAAMLTTAVLYRRELAIAAGGCAPHARALDDHVLNANVARIAGPIPVIDSRELLYRVHPSSTSTISPMVGPFLSTQAAIRLGGIFPREVRGGANLDHLLFGLARSGLSTSEQLGLLLLSTSGRNRARWLMRWIARRARIR